MFKHIPDNYLIIFLMLFWSIKLNAQTNYSTTLYTQKDGLPSSTIKGIGKDKTGFLWLMSENGLTRFDGYNFYTFSHQPNSNDGISSVANEMLGCENGKLLFRFQNSISIYNPNNGQFKKVLNIDRYEDIREYFSNQWGFWIKQKNRIININPTNDAITTYQFPETFTEANSKLKIYPAHSFWITKNDSIINFNVDSKQFLFVELKYLKSYKKPEVITFPIYYKEATGYTSFYRNDGHFEFNPESQTFQQVTNKLIEDNYNPLNGFSQSGPNIVKTLAYNIFSLTNLHTGIEKVYSLQSEKNETNHKIGINKVFCASDGTVWVSTASEGIFRFNEKMDLVEHITKDKQGVIALPSNDVHFIFCYDNILWITLPGVGILKCEPKLPLMKYYQPIHDLRLTEHFNMYKNTRAILELNPNELLIGTLEGLYRFNQTTKKITLFQPKNNIKNLPYKISASAIIKDASQNIWIADWHGENLFVMAKNTQLIVKVPIESVMKSHYQQTIRCLFLDSHGFIWVGTAGNSIFKINSNSFDFNNPLHCEIEEFKGSISNSLVFYNTFAFAESHSSDILIGSNSGLYIYENQNRSIKRFMGKSGKEKISDDDIRSFHIDKKGIIWIGTKSGGLNRFDEENLSFSVYNTTNGLPDNSIYSILDDQKGNLWLGTNNGICRFNTANGNCRNYTIDDGIQHEEFNTNAACRLSDGELVFGGINGFNILNPDSLNIKREIPSIVVTQILVDDKEINDEKIPLNLKPTQKSISFQFAALGFYRNNETKYACRLEGLNDQWIDCKFRRYVNYSNLAPGSYVFHVKAETFNGDWTEESSISFSVLNPWYKTWFFKIALLVATFGILYGIVKYRINETLKVQKIRDHIARDLHDEIGSTLSSVAVYSQIARNVIKQKAPESNQLMDQISENISSLMQSVNDTVWSLNTKNNSFENVINQMRALSVELLEAKGCELHFEAIDDFNGLQIDIDQRKNFYLIFKEALNNLTKYASAKKVYVYVSLEGKFLNMKIIDDGIGFEKGKEHKGNGIDNMHKRALALNGTLNIKSSLGNGTLIELTFKIK